MSEIGSEVKKRLDVSTNLSYIDLVNSLKNLTKKGFSQLEGVQTQDPQIWLKLGICYERGICVKVEYDKAIDYFKKAATIGCAASYNGLGLCYLKKKDSSKAFAAFKQGVKGNNIDAYYNLGICYLDDKGVPQKEQSNRKEKGLSFLELAAKKGYIKAFNDLGNYHQNELGHLDSFLDSFEKKQPSYHQRLEGEAYIRKVLENLLKAINYYLKAQTNAEQAEIKQAKENLLQMLVNKNIRGGAKRGGAKNSEELCDFSQEGRLEDLFCEIIKAAKINAVPRNKEGTALHYACKYQHIDCAKILILAGANNKKNTMGKKSLDFIKDLNSKGELIKLHKLKKKARSLILIEEVKILFRNQSSIESFFKTPRSKDFGKLIKLTELCEKEISDSPRNEIIKKACCFLKRWLLNFKSCSERKILDGLPEVVSNDFFKKHHPLSSTFKLNEELTIENFSLYVIFHHIVRCLEGQKRFMKKRELLTDKFEDIRDIIIQGLPAHGNHFEWISIDNAAFEDSEAPHKNFSVLYTDPPLRKEEHAKELVKNLNKIAPLKGLANYGRGRDKDGYVVSIQDLRIARSRIEAEKCRNTNSNLPKFAHILKFFTSKDWHNLRQVSQDYTNIKLPKEKSVSVKRSF